MGFSRAVGLAVGMGLDAIFADPSRGHPVAGMGWVADRLERLVYADSRRAGVVHEIACVAPIVVIGQAVAARPGRSRRVGTVQEIVALSVAAWIVIGGRSLSAAGERIADRIDAGDLNGARELIPLLCGRDPLSLDADGVVRAALESIAENTSDAIVGPLVWGAMAGIPGLLIYRMVNTLDAMVGHKNQRYRRFGWAAARTDDVMNIVPARLTGLSVIILGPDRRGAIRAWRRDAAAHPSPNAGVAESSFAGALGIRLGGRTVYAHTVEERPTLGDGGVPRVADLRAACRLSRRVGVVACVIATVAAACRR